MRHFIAYHSTEKMGHPLHEGDPFRLLTKKPVAHLVGATIWFITGERNGHRQYALGSGFVVSEVGETSEAGFAHFAAGTGHVFKPPVQLDSEEWFPNLLRRMGNFGLGVQEVADERVIETFKQFAHEAGAAI